MSDLAGFRVDDLVYPNSKVTFILESPHTQEVTLGYPAAGDTGVNMSKVLFNLDEPIGTLLNSGVDLQNTISILNCSRLPLKKSCYGKLKLQNNFKNFLEIHEQRDISIPILKSKIKSKLNTLLGKKAVSNFQTRLQEHLVNSQDTKLVVCGIIAQCFFEEATELQGYLRKSTQLNWQGNSTTVFYEYHPSSLAKQWTNSSNMNELLGYVS